MIQTTILQIPSRELWVDNGLFHGREWRADTDGAWQLDPAPRAFATYGEAIDWMTAPLKA